MYTGFSAAMYTGVAIYTGFSAPRYTVFSAAIHTGFSAAMYTGFNARSKKKVWHNKDFTGWTGFPFKCFDCQGRTFCILYFQMRELILLAFSLYCLVVTLFFALTLLWNCFYCLNACNCLWVGHYFWFFIAQKLFLLHLPNYCFAFVLPEWGK